MHTIHVHTYAHSCTQVGRGRVFDEVEIDELLTARRAAQPGFIEPSFSTIAGVLREAIL